MYLVDKVHCEVFRMHENAEHDEPEEVGRWDPDAGRVILHEDDAGEAGEIGRVEEQSTEEGGRRSSTPTLASACGAPAHASASNGANPRSQYRSMQRTRTDALSVCAPPFKARGGALTNVAEVRRLACSIGVQGGHVACRRLCGKSL